MSERLETAIADKREHPEHEWQCVVAGQAYRLILADGLWMMTTVNGGYSCCPANFGWTLVVEEHKRQCPRCWSTLELSCKYHEYCVWCPTCRLSDGQRYDTPDQAWAAWDSWIPIRDRRVSGWHRPEERPPKEGLYPVISERGMDDVSYWHPARPWEERAILAWHDQLGVPPWVTP